jgi:hypothetical protein
MPKYKIGDKVLFDMTSQWYNANAGVVMTVAFGPDEDGDYKLIGGDSLYSKTGIWETEKNLIPAVLLA